MILVKIHNSLKEKVSTELAIREYWKLSLKEIEAHAPRYILGLDKNNVVVGVIEGAHAEIATLTNCKRFDPVDTGKGKVCFVGGQFYGVLTGHHLIGKKVSGLFQNSKYFTPEQFTEMCE